MVDGAGGGVGFSVVRAGTLSERGRVGATGAAAGGSGSSSITRGSGSEKIRPSVSQLDAPARRPVDAGQHVQASQLVGRGRVDLEERGDDLCARTKLRPGNSLDPLPNHARRRRPDHTFDGFGHLEGRREAMVTIRR